MFSIIIPIYNVEEYIYDCLDSILKQTDNNFEVILIDDGSTDNSSVICREFVRKRDNFIYFKKINGGLSDARNFGLQHASKDYVIFVDGDDYIDKATIENFRNYISKLSFQPDILTGESYSVDNLALKKNSVSHELNKSFNGVSYYKDCLINNCLEVPTWLHIYRREFLIENNLFFTKGLFHEDEDHTVRCYLTAKSVVETGFYFYYYRIREGSIMTDNRNLPSRIDDLKTTYKSLRQKVIMLMDKELLRYFDSYWMNVFLHYFILVGMTDFSSAKQMISIPFISEISATGVTKIRKNIFMMNPKIYFWIQKMYLNYKGI